MGDLWGPTADAGDGYVDEDGSISGVSVDLWRRVAERLEPQFRLTPVADMESVLRGLEEGRFDAAIGAITITSQRAERVDFSIPRTDPASPSPFVGNGARSPLSPLTESIAEFVGPLRLRSPRLPHFTRPDASRVQGYRRKIAFCLRPANMGARTRPRRAYRSRAGSTGGEVEVGSCRLMEMGILSASAPEACVKSARYGRFDFSSVLHDEASAPLAAKRGGSQHEFDCPTEIPT